MFMSAGSSMIMFGAKFKHLVITLSREGSKSTIDKLLQPIVYILLRGGWTYTTSMFFAFSCKKFCSLISMLESTS